MTTTDNISFAGSFVSNHPKRHRLITLSLLVALCLLSGCDLLQKKAPEIESILTVDSQISGFCDIDALPIDWNRAGELWLRYEPSFRKHFGDEWIDNIKSSQIKASDISKMALSVDTFDFASDGDVMETLSQTGWILAVDIHGFLPADLIEFGINSQKEKNGLVAKRNGNWDAFERIDIYDSSSEQFLLSVAVFSAKTTQLRIGQPGKLEQSILHPSEPTSLSTEKLIPENQAWLNLEIPEELLTEISQMEDLLPIDTGALLSGFRSITTSYQLTDYALNTLLSLGFDNRESADTAFSILSLSNSFLLKPALKKSVGDARHFIKSIDTERNNDSVQYSFSIDQSDTEAIKAAIEKAGSSPLLSYALDLINQR